MEPTILLNVPVTSDAYQEEIFGPVLIVNTFKTEEDALQEANGTEFGLFCKFISMPVLLISNIYF
jgi:aldehyde dehydrogenase (NAD+)